MPNAELAIDAPHGISANLAPRLELPRSRRAHAARSLSPCELCAIDAVQLIDTGLASRILPIRSRRAADAVQIQRPCKIRATDAAGSRLTCQLPLAQGTFLGVLLLHELSGTVTCKHAGVRPCFGQHGMHGLKPKRRYSISFPRCPICSARGCLYKLCATPRANYVLRTVPPDLRGAKPRGPRL